MAQIRVGIMGFGFIGQLHAKAVTNCPDTELAGVWTLADGSDRKFREDYPGGRLFASPAELVAAPEVEAVVIGLPNSLHHPEALRALAAGKHVLVEKPMALTVAQAEEMAAMARQADCRLMVGHMWRFDREFQAARALVAEGTIGSVVKTKGYGIHRSWGPTGWFTRRELAGGGALVDMGVHAIDAVRYLLGDPEPLSVSAVIGTHYGDYDVDDTGLLLIRWSNGVASMVESGWWQPHMDGPEASTQLFGRTGYIRVFPTMATFTDGRPPWRPRFPERSDHCDQHIYDGQMAEFARAIEQRREPTPGASHGLTIMRICDAAYRSAASGETVRL